MELKQEDFNKMQYHVHLIDDVLDKFPELKRFPEFLAIFKKLQLIENEWVEVTSGIDRNMVLKYIFYCYDKNSPFVSEKNMIRRKVLCAQKAGFATNKEGRFEIEVDAILKGENEIANRMIIRFVRNQKDLKFSLLVAGMEAYYDNILKLAEYRKKEGAKAGNEKTELFNGAKDMLEDIEKLADEVFNQDKELMFVADEVNQEEEEKITSWPEYWSSKRINANSKE